VFALPGVFCFAGFAEWSAQQLAYESAMNIKSILFPTDFSHYNDAALEYASTLAAEAKATLHIVYVHDVRELNAAAGEASYLFAATWEKEKHAAEKRLKKVTPTVKGVTYEHYCLVGDPVTDILALADEKKAELIVMASHGRSGLSRLIMGSIAEGVMRKATCPVLVVKQPNKQDERNAHPSDSSEEFRLVS
jgi:nucleotide-binding universal stress UspA family protein